MLCAYFFFFYLFKKGKWQKQKPIWSVVLNLRHFSAAQKGSERAYLRHGWAHSVAFGPLWSCWVKPKNQSFYYQHCIVGFCSVSICSFLISDVPRGRAWISQWPDSVTQVGDLDPPQLSSCPSRPDPTRNAIIPGVSSCWIRPWQGVMKKQVASNSPYPIWLLDPSLSYPFLGQSDPLLNILWALLTIE